MRNFSKIALTFILSSAFAAGFSQGSTFDYSFTFGDFGFVSGSFEGTQNGNLINGITNASVFINGNSIDSGAGIFAEGYNASHKFENGLAQVSPDGSQNSFLFANADFGGGQAYSGAFFSVGNGAGNPALMQAEDQAHSFYNYNLAFLSPANWSVIEHSSQSVPEAGSTVGLFASAALGLAAFRRRILG